jgi:transposase-like protein
MLKMIQIIPDEAAAYEYLESLRWPDGQVVCPKCGVVSDKHYLLPPPPYGRVTTKGLDTGRRVWKCKSCRKQFTVLTDTFLHGTHVPVRKWVLVMFEMCANKNGIAAREIERRYEVAPKTAWFMTQRLRAAMGNRQVPPFSGDVVADETYIGGDPMRMHADKREKLGAKSGHASHKTPVVSVIDVDTQVSRSKAIEWVDSASLRQVLTETTDLGTTVLHTDSHLGYLSVARKMAGHHRVNHKAGEYVTEKSRGTQLAENLFGQLKRSLDGTHHHVSRKHLQRYLGEFDFRYSTRQESDGARLAIMLGQLEGRLMYRNLIGRAPALPKLLAE